MGEAKSLTERLDSAEAEQPVYLPPKIAVDGKGFYWRCVSDEMWSMCPTNPDNSPTPEPITYYVPESELTEVRSLMRTFEKAWHEQERLTDERDRQLAEQATQLREAQARTPNEIARLAVNHEIVKREQAEAERDALREQLREARDQLLLNGVRIVNLERQRDALQPTPPQADTAPREGSE